jgi:hypothetical protein
VKLAARMFAVAVALLIAVTLPASAGTTRTLMISTESAAPTVPFKGFDTALKAYDFDGDGRKEIIGHNENRHVYVFHSGTGKILADLVTTVPAGGPAP